MADETRGTERQRLREFLRGSEESFTATLNHPDYDDNFQVQSLQAAAQSVTAYAVLNLAEEVAALRVAIGEGRNNG